MSTASIDPVFAQYRRDPRFLRRLDLQHRIIHISTHPEREALMQDLRQMFSQEDILLVLDLFQQRLRRPTDPVAQESDLYLLYAARYNRFGGTQPGLSYAEWDTITDRIPALSARKWAKTLTPEERAELDLLESQLVHNAELMIGLLPDNPALQPLPEQASPELLAQVRDHITQREQRKGRRGGRQRRR